MLFILVLISLLLRELLCFNCRTLHFLWNIVLVHKKAAPNGCRNVFYLMLNLLRSFGRLPGEALASSAIFFMSSSFIIPIYEASDKMRLRSIVFIL